MFSRFDGGKMWLKAQIQLPNRSSFETVVLSAKAKREETMVMVPIITVREASAAVLVHNSRLRKDNSYSEGIYLPEVKTEIH